MLLAVHLWDGFVLWSSLNNFATMKHLRGMGGASPVFHNDFARSTATRMIAHLIYLIFDLLPAGLTWALV